MLYIIYLPLIILLFVLFKHLISFIDKSTSTMKNKINLSQAENGILSIKDLQKNNYEIFINVITSYLENLDCKNLDFLPNSCSELTNLVCNLNGEDIYVSCIQNELLGDTPTEEDNWTLTKRSDVQRMLARMCLNTCKKGIIINNSSFSDEAISFTNDINKNLNIEIKLVDGYSLTQSVRNHKNYTIKEEHINEI